MFCILSKICPLQWLIGSNNDIAKGSETLQEVLRACFKTISVLLFFATLSFYFIKVDISIDD